MWEVILKWLPWAIMFVLFTALLVLVHKKFKKNNVLETIANRYRENMDEKMIRLYLHGDQHAPWERSAGAIRCAAAAGVTNIVFGTLPSR